MTTPRTSLSSVSDMVMEHGCISFLDCTTHCEVVLGDIISFALGLMSGQDFVCTMEAEHFQPEPNSWGFNKRS